MISIYNALELAGLAALLPTPLTTEQEQRLKQFLDLRQAWSKTHNLSGPKALGLLSTDIVDAVAVWLCAPQEFPLIDIGSGSGVPGLMLACLSPEHSIHLVEPIAKRCAFMKTAAHRLGLKKVTVHRSRWPDSRFKEDKELVAISRAVVSPEDWPLLADQPQVIGIMQMLAHQRPEWPLTHYTFTKEVHYSDPEGGERVVRLWLKK